MTEQQEQIIIHKIIAGDANAFACLVDNYKNMAVFLACNILLNQQDAEEVAQDAFVKAYAALPSFKADSRFSTWLYRIVVNTALNKQKLKKQYWLEITDEQVTGEDEILANHITSEHKKYIQTALRLLSVNERLCITLYYLNELSIGEIHDLTQISHSNIKVLLHRGRKNLYAALRQHLKREITNLI